MRFAIDIHLSFGKGEDEQRDSDATGYLVDASSTTGFTRPEPIYDDDRGSK